MHMFMGIDALENVQKRQGHFDDPAYYELNLCSVS